MAELIKQWLLNRAGDCLCLVPVLVSPTHQFAGMCSIRLGPLDVSTSIEMSIRRVLVGAAQAVVKQ